jgi:hypothetical protein
MINRVFGIRFKKAKRRMGLYRMILRFLRGIRPSTIRILFYGLNKRKSERLWIEYHRYLEMKPLCKDLILVMNPELVELIRDRTEVYLSTSKFLNRERRGFRGRNPGGR